MENELKVEAVRLALQYRGHDTQFYNMGYWQVTQPLEKILAEAGAIYEFISKR